jgi:hypothetical protein
LTGAIGFAGTIEGQQIGKNFSHFNKDYGRLVLTALDAHFAKAQRDL